MTVVVGTLTATGALEQAVAGAVDVAHAARAQPDPELVTVGEEFRDRRHASQIYPATLRRIPSRCRRAGSGTRRENLR